MLSQKCRAKKNSHSSCDRWIIFVLNVASIPLSDTISPRSDIWYADPQLPLIDLGCGNGTQTRFLANHFAKVIGTEISPAAVQIARTKHAAPNASYRVLDVLRPDDAQALHEEIGDANVYVRAVLHQLSPSDHATAIQSIERLLGAKGILYLIELSSSAEPFFAQLIQQYGPPPGLARVFQHSSMP
jgi:SAM-dependent methyltransferase